MTRLRHCLSLVLVAGSLAALPAQEEKAKPKKLALLVGVLTYERSNHFPDLKYTENDVDKLGATLEKAGYEVRVLSASRGKKDKKDAPTAANVRKALADLVAERRKGDA